MHRTLLNLNTHVGVPVSAIKINTRRYRLEAGSDEPDGRYLAYRHIPHTAVSDA